MSPAPACSWTAASPRLPQPLDLKGRYGRPPAGLGAWEYSTRFGENHASWAPKQLPYVRLCRMMNFSSRHRGQGCHLPTDATASSRRANTPNLRRVAPQARQVQRVVRPLRQRTPSVRQPHAAQCPGAVTKSQPHAQHTHLVTAPAAFCTSAPSVEHPQTLQWACCHAVTRQSMNRLWPQRTHSQIITGFSRLGTRRHRVLWPHASQWASWGLKYGSLIVAVWRPRGPWSGNGLAPVPPGSSDSTSYQGSAA